jgi:hypothetical protein
MQRIPIIADVDVFVIGGTSGGAACARAAAAAGASVFLAAERTYLGHDICGHWRYWPAAPEAPTQLSKQLFAPSPAKPLHVKRTLEQALLGAGAPFLFGSYPAGALKAADGRIAGAVIANRTGLQAVRARHVVDATWRGTLARQAGLPFTPWPAGTHTVERIVVGGPELPGTEYETRGEIAAGDARRPVRAYRTEVDLPDATPDSFAAAEVEARCRLWHPEQLFAGESLYLLPPDPVEAGADRVGRWPGAAALPLGCLHGGPGLSILGPAADLSPDAAHGLADPHAWIAVGERLGASLAGEKADAVADEKLQYLLAGAEPCGNGQTRILTAGPRGQGHEGPTLEIDLEALPCLAEVDVMVAGGGTAGAPAGIGAARAGAKTLVAEYQAELGGVGTVGLIARYWHGNPCGFTAEMDAALGACQPEGPETQDWNVECKQMWYLNELHKAGAAVWFQTATVGARVENGAVTGALLAGPHGFGWVRAGASVDATGNADLAAAAGAPCAIAGDEEIAVQGTGLPPRTPGRHYQNSDHSFSDDCDLVDATGFLVSSKVKFRDAFDLSQIVDSRERRQIVGEMTLQPVDFLAERQYPDAICLAKSNFDSHGFTVHPLFMAKAPDKAGMSAYVPYRCLLPQGVENVLVTGLAVSAQRDSLPVVRMQPDVQNQGYAAGYAAAMARRSDCTLREVELDALQAHLVDVGILPAEARGAADTFPVSDEAIEQAVHEEWDTLRGLAVCFGFPERARPILRKAFTASTDPTQTLRYAKVLGLMGEGHGADRLVEHITATGWDAGWNYRGMGQFGMSLSEVDTSLIALAKSGDPRTPELVERMGRALGAEPDLSHCRALALAAEAMPSPRCAAALTRILRLPGMAAHAIDSIGAYQSTLTDHINETRPRDRSLREIFLARALYRCGDDDQGLGHAVLQTYAGDIRGHFARHARSVLHG